MKFKGKVHITLAVICFILCFTAVTQFKSVTLNSSIGKEEGNLGEEKNKLANANQQIIDLQKENMQLTTDIEIYRREAAAEDNGAVALKNELEKMRTVSGFTNVEGEGITVEIADSKVKDSERGNESLIVHDSDLRSVVNELYGAGAEAISINGERLIINSPIRCVGNTVMINNTRCSSPFIIKAIGKSDALESALLIRGGIVDELKDSTIEVSITKSNNIKIDKYTGAVELYYAADSKK